MKTISTLIPDIHEVLEGKGGWDKAVSSFFGDWLEEKSYEIFAEPEARRDWIGLSAVGRPCDREKWYITNEIHKAAPLRPEAHGNFFYGHMLEAFAISLAIAAGHRVEGLQEELDVYGIPGHGDCIIDGRVVDVKSASQWQFQKFQYHQLKGYEKKTKDGYVQVPASEVDGFGYISQLSSYLDAYKNDKRVHDKENASFFVINKNTFKLCLDTYNLKDELARKEAEIKRTHAVTSGPKPPRGFEDEPDGVSGNMKLKTHCAYCDFKKDCWPGLRTFIYSNGPRYLTKVVREPAATVREVTE